MSIRVPPPCWDLFRAEVIHMEPGLARVRFFTEEAMANPYGLVQGGLLAAMADNCIGPAVYSLAPEKRSMTIELKVNFLSAVRPGEVLTCEATVVRAGKSTAYVEATVTAPVASARPALPREGTPDNALPEPEGTSSFPTQGPPGPFQAIVPKPAKIVKTPRDEAMHDDANEERLVARISATNLFLDD